MNDIKYCKKCNNLLIASFQFCPACGEPINKKNMPKAKRRPKGAGCIRKKNNLRNKPYEVRKDGKFLGYFETEKDAQLFLLGYVNKTITDFENITLGEIYERWKETDKYENLSHHTKNNYNSAWTRLEPQKKIKMRDIRTSHLQKAIELAKEQGHGRDTCEKIRSLASVLCQFAMKDDIISRNYALQLELPKKVITKKQNFTEDDILKLFYAEHERDARIILCLIYTGTRINEFFTILKENVNIEKGYMIGGIKTEAGKDRVIPIRSEIMPYIIDFMNENPKSKYLVCNEAGRKMDSSNFTSRNYYPMLDKVGIEYKDENNKNLLTPHRSRHTYISESIKAKMAPEALMKIVGHSNYSTSVNKYDELVDIDYLKKEAQKGL